MIVSETAEQASLFQRLGGRPAISAVVDEFYQRILADPKVRDLFASVDMDKQRQHQVPFIMSALGGPSAQAHAGLTITPRQFDLVAGHLSDAPRVFSVPQPPSRPSSTSSRASGATWCAFLDDASRERDRPRRQSRRLTSRA